MLALLLFLIVAAIISAEDAWHAHYHRLGNMLIHNSPAPSLTQSLLGPHHNFSIPEVQLRRGECDASCMQLAKEADQSVIPYMGTQSTIKDTVHLPTAPKLMRPSFHITHAATRMAAPLAHAPPAHHAPPFPHASAFCAMLPQSHVL